MGRFLVASMLAIASLSADFSYGWQTLEHSTLSTLNQNGSVTLNDVTINGPAKVNGHVKADGCRFQSLEANGRVDLENSSFSSNLKINGYLTADNCHFEKEIMLSTNKAVLKNSIAHDIRVKGNYYPLQPSLDLSGSTVMGLIVFENGGGEIITNSKTNLDNATIQGAVIN